MRGIDRRGPEILIIVTLFLLLGIFVLIGSPISRSESIGGADLSQTKSDPAAPVHPNEQATSIVPIKVAVPSNVSSEVSSAFDILSDVGARLPDDSQPTTPLTSPTSTVDLAQSDESQATSEHVVAETSPTIALPDPSPTSDAQSQAELQAEIERYILEKEGVYGIAIWDSRTGATVLINADRQVYAASTYKLLVMARVYEEFAEGSLTRDDTITILDSDTVEGDSAVGLSPGDTIGIIDALDAMIIVSDNTSSHALARTLGGFSNVGTLAQNLGLSQTDFSGEYVMTSPQDMLLLLRSLDEGKVVSPEASERMIERMSAQQVNDRIPALLPEGTLVAHKTGELPDVRNDVGIVHYPGGRFAIAAFGEADYESEAIETIANVSLIAYRHFATSEP